MNINMENQNKLLKTIKIHNPKFNEYIIKNIKCIGYCKKGCLQHIYHVNKQKYSNNVMYYYESNNIQNEKCKLRKLRDNLKDNPLRYEINNISHELFNKIYDEVKINDKQNGCYDQCNMSNILYKYLGNGFNQDNSLDDFCIKYLDSFHESNKILIKKISNIFTNPWLNYLKEDDMFLLNLYFKFLFLRIYSKGDTLINNNHNMYYETLKKYGLNVTPCTEYDLVMNEIKNNIIYPKKRDALNELISIYRGMLGLKQKSLPKSYKKKQIKKTQIKKKLIKKAILEILLLISSLISLLMSIILARLSKYSIFSNALN